MTPLGRHHPARRHPPRARHHPTKPGFDEDGTKLKWMEILEESAEWDPDIKELLDGANANPKEVEDRIRARFDKRKDKVLKEREGSTVPMLVKFGEFTLEQPVDLGGVAQPDRGAGGAAAWTRCSKRGSCSGSSAGSTRRTCRCRATFFEVSHMTYDMELANGESDVPACVFHAMGGPEYKGRWARAWFDLGSADEMCVDVLINSLITFCREYFGLKTLVIGGANVVDDWRLEGVSFSWTTRGRWNRDGSVQAAAAWDGHGPDGRRWECHGDDT
jgi:hypothetical protein